MARDRPSWAQRFDEPVRRSRLLVRFADDSLCVLSCWRPGVRDEVVAALRRAA